MFDLFFFFRFSKIKCPDGTTRIVYRNINDIFPFSIKELNQSVHGKVSAADLGSIDSAATYAEKISSLLVSIDNDNGDLMIMFRANYASYAANPCGHSVALESVTRDIIRQHSKIKEIRSKVKMFIECAKSGLADEKQIKEKYRDLISLNSEYIDAGDVSDEIKRSKATMNDIQG